MYPEKHLHCPPTRGEEETSAISIPPSLASPFRSRPSSHKQNAGFSFLGTPSNRDQLIISDRMSISVIREKFHFEKQGKPLKTHQWLGQQSRAGIPSRWQEDVKGDDCNTCPLLLSSSFFRRRSTRRRRRSRGGEARCTERNAFDRALLFLIFVYLFCPFF